MLENSSQRMIQCTDALCEAISKKQNLEELEVLLWECMIAYQEFPFTMASGKVFTYQIKIGRKGQYTKELLINRREKSKPLTWSSIAMAFRKAITEPVPYKGPKQLGNIRGVSYIYPMLIEFGIIKTE